MTYTNEQIMEFLVAGTDPGFPQSVQFALDNGLAKWRDDPEHTGVVGLVLTADTDRAVVLVYMEEEDLEFDFEWLNEMYRARHRAAGQN